ncbi:bifunctional phosphoribosylaminoimidazolecarboxamide formyltransferase/IMP cyclohydrolase [Candidatus Daviesbacteria bacterium]|nr:bifunctional phosphoribosylaminoimidazolecarboxamide formyltransferase/IMP cyclohydrolase [Candidatus Daviesbacteria bacterium]
MAYALLSVSDKTGIVDLAKTLTKLKFQIISTSGTYQHLASHLKGVKLIPIQEITGNPESFDGRMKTISFQIEGGILYDRKNKIHLKEARKLKVPKIDIVVCNLYPFEASPSIENIDVGGPTMIRAAAKNYADVLILVDPRDYKRVSRHLIKCHSERSEESKKVRSFANAQDGKFHKELAAKAFYHLSFYDSQIGRHLLKEKFPKEITLAGRKIKELRYGENPHQKASFYLEPNTTSPLKNIQGYWGRQLSLTNLTDINAGILAIRLFKEPSGVVIKHNSPCGIALGKTLDEALQRAIEADPESAFGGVIVINSPLDLKTAKVIFKFKKDKRGLIDIVAAPSINNEALELLKKVRKSMGIYSFGEIKKDVKEVNWKWLIGGFILQESDNYIEKSFNSWEVVTKNKPTKSQLEKMRIAWKFATFIRSNCIVVVDKNLPMTRGIGTGQTSRLRAVQIALKQANTHAKDGILASDSFFPFDDCVKLAAKSGISAIVQQGDSINDDLSVKAANKAGIPMIFTHHRAFWH